MILAKSVIKDKFWILEENAKRVGMMNFKDNNYTINLKRKDLVRQSPEWEAAKERLRSRGLMKNSGTHLELTVAGVEVKLFIEHSTDSGSSSPVSVAGEKKTTELIELMKPWISAIMDADVIGAWKMREQLWRDLPAVKNV